MLAYLFPRYLRNWVISVSTLQMKTCLQRVQNLLLISFLSRKQRSWIWTLATLVSGRLIL